MTRRIVSSYTKKELENVFKKVDRSAYWGRGVPRKSETAIRPFTIRISDEVIKDLQFRLKNTRELVPPLEGIQQQYGLNTNTLKEIIHHWAHKYNWKEREKYLNQFPQFQTEIQGLNIQFLRAKPKNPSLKTLPLLLLHGWPGSVTEFYKIIPLLTDCDSRRDFAFEVIAPSLPGYAFSEGASKPGLGATEVGVVLKNLMGRLGFEEFYVQGGDWGGIIGRDMATLFPENVLGLHTNFALVHTYKTILKLIFGKYLPQSVFPERLKSKFYPLRRHLEGLLEETGYFHIQATKPDTIGVALNDSPAGLASYILEKFSTGTRGNYKFVHGAGFVEKFTYDELLDNVMLYWVTNSMTTAMRLYAETFSKRAFPVLMNTPIDPIVPCAIARFRHEVVFFPDFILRDKYTNIIQSTDFESGGHFAAFEEPKLLADDVFAAVSKMEKLRV